MVKESTAYEVRKEGLRDQARIIRVGVKKASEIYGQKTKIPEQLLIEACANVKGWVGRIGTIPKPPSNLVSPQSRMGKFIRRYKKPPEPGMLVNVIRA
jgi:hypothetical protein